MYNGAPYQQTMLIPMEQVKRIQRFLDRTGIPHTQGTATLNWKQIFKKVQQDRHFYQLRDEFGNEKDDVAWDFLCNRNCKIWRTMALLRAQRHWERTSSTSLHAQQHAQQYSRLREEVISVLPWALLWAAFFYSPFNRDAAGFLVVHHWLLFLGFTIGFCFAAWKQANDEMHPIASQTFRARKTCILLKDAKTLRDAIKSDHDQKRDSSSGSGSRCKKVKAAETPVKALKLAHGDQLRRISVSDQARFNFSDLATAALHCFGSPLFAFTREDDTGGIALITSDADLQEAFSTASLQGRSSLQLRAHHGPQMGARAV
jgi:hypothetical protein